DTSPLSSRETVSASPRFTASISSSLMRAMLARREEPGEARERAMKMTNPRGKKTQNVSTACGASMEIDRSYRERPRNRVNLEILRKVANRLIASTRPQTGRALRTQDSIHRHKT